MKFCEAELTDAVLEQLIAFSQQWEDERNCYGYRKNTKKDIEGNRVFLAEENDRTIGYLFGSVNKTKEASPIASANTTCFEVEELYILPEYRSRGVGRELFAFVENTMKENAVDYLFLSTATKDYKAILHFYIDELNMSFWNARLFKEL